MAEQEQNKAPANAYFGRRKIFVTDEYITRDNIIPLMNLLLSVHAQNMMEEDYLYWYRRGLQPILNRQKQVRPEINNKAVENHAAEIVSFKNGYFLTQPAFYIARRKTEDGEDVNSRIQTLNEMLYLSGKQNADNQVVDWFHTVGVGTLYVEPFDDPDCPVRAYALDPRSSFVAYSRRPGNEPVLGCNIVVTGKTGGSTQVVFDVFTRDRYFKLAGGYTSQLVTGGVEFGTAIDVLEERPNVLGAVPIIEYLYENNRMGAFESVLPLLDGINTVESNRMDGIEQFIQSLMIFYNCQLGENEQGQQITPSYIRQAGAIFLKSIGQDKADLKILSEQLDQTQTQVLVDYMYQQAMAIAGVPTANNTTTSTSDNVGAVYLRSGWATADTFARNTEDLFRVANRYFDRIFTRILRLKGVVDVPLPDFELQFTRNEMNNLLVKTQGALNLKQLGLSPEIALGRSGVSSDPIADVALSKRYIDQAWGAADTSERINESRTEIVEDDV